MNEYLVTVLEDNRIICKIKINESQKNLLDKLEELDLFYDCHFVATPLERDEIIDLTR